MTSRFPRTTLAKVTLREPGLFELQLTDAKNGELNVPRFTETQSITFANNSTARGMKTMTAIPMKTSNNRFLEMDRLNGMCFARSAVDRFVNKVVCGDALALFRNCPMLALIRSSPTRCIWLRN